MNKNMVITLTYIGVFLGNCSYYYFTNGDLDELTKISYHQLTMAFLIWLNLTISQKRG